MAGCGSLVSARWAQGIQLQSLTGWLRDRMVHVERLIKLLLLIYNLFFFSNFINYHWFSYVNWRRSAFHLLKPKTNKMHCKNYLFCDCFDPFSTIRLVASELCESRGPYWLVGDKNVWYPHELCPKQMLSPNHASELLGFLSLLYIPNATQEDFRSLSGFSLAFICTL